MAELTIEEARKIYASSDDMKSLMLTKFTKEDLEEDYTSSSYDNQNHGHDSQGNDFWCDINGNVIHKKAPNGFEAWFNTDGKVIHKKHSDGFEEWVDYDSYGRTNHVNDSDGSERWYEYNANGQYHTLSFLMGRNGGAISMEIRVIPSGPTDPNRGTMPMEMTFMEKIPMDRNAGMILIAIKN